MVDSQQEHKVDYSVVIPVYNGAHSLKELCERIVAYFEGTSYSWEIIFVDDRSIDNSWDEILKLKEKFTSKVSGLRLSRNFGQHNAICSGFKAAHGKFIITIDDDIENDPRDIEKLIEGQKKGAKLVYGISKNKEKAFFRSLFKSIYKLIAKAIEGKSRVNGASFRLLTSELAKKVENNATHFIFIDEACLWYTEEIEYVNVTHLKSKRGKSNYSLFGLFKLTGEVVLYSSILPLKLVKYLGFSVATINLILGVYYLIKKFAFGFAIPGFASIIISILFSTGMIMFTLGLVGEYLAKMYRIMNNRPVYSVDEEI